jgi:NADPH:quinone reductase-like Zn-dependent oxidoreductase
MEAMQVVQSPNDGLTLRAAQVAQPVPGKGDVLVRVFAAGVTPTELEWSPTTQQKDGKARLHAIPAHEFSGVVEAVGEGVSGFAKGQAVYGMNDWYAEGAMAEFCLTQPGSIAAKPAKLTHEEAATVPIGALTAWQGLFDKGKLQAGEKVLVHGGAGGVGMFVVQLAHRHGAHVIATASAQTLGVVKGLGADEVIDYRKARFEELVRDVDVVFDTVGGETLERSWSVMKPQGRMVTVSADGESSNDPRIKQNYFIVEANGERLGELAKLFDNGSLKTFVSAAVPLAEAAAAYARKVPQMLGYGKVVVTIARGA